MAQSKHIKTSEVQLWRKRKNWGYALPLVLLLLFGAWLIPKWTRSGFAIDGIALLLIALLALFASVPCFLIWNAVCRQKWKNALQRTQFDAEQDLEYYRDKLTDLSPAQISLLTDLKLERKKDLTATLLKLQLKGVISIEDGCVTVSDVPKASLCTSDQLLLSYLKDHPRLSDETVNGLAHWEKAALEEAAEGGFFKVKEPPKKYGFRQTGCLQVILAFVLMVILLFNKDTAYFNEVSERVANASAEVSNQYFVQMVTEDARFARGVLWTVLGSMAGLYFLAYPLATVVRGFLQTSADKQLGIQRTAKGMEYTEYVYGLKNFIHDFSNLAEAQKEQLILWDDFLIYAVVLEENTQILDEIFKRRNPEPGAESAYSAIKAFDEGSFL